MALRTLDLKEQIVKMAEKLRKWQHALDRAVIAIEKINPDARQFFAVNLDNFDEYVGMSCKTCEGLHDVEIGLEGQLKQDKRFRHREGCPVATLEEVLAKFEYVLNREATARR